MIYKSDFSAWSRLILFSALYTGRISMGRSLFHHLASELMTIGDNEVHVCIFFSSLLRDYQSRQADGD